MLRFGPQLRVLRYLSLLRFPILRAVARKVTMDDFDGGFSLFLALVVLALVGRGIQLSTARMATLQERTARLAAIIAFGIAALVCLRGLLGRRPDPIESIGHGLIAGLVVLLLLTFLLPVVVFAYAHLLKPLIRPINRSWTYTSGQYSQKPARREERKETADPERARREAETLRTQQEANRRRADARASCELFYNLHAPEIGSRFSKEAFSDFVARHLGDNQPVEYVEQRTAQLLTVLRQHLAMVVPTIDYQPLEEILATFDDRIRRIRESMIDARDKEVILIQLEQERDQALRRAVSEGRL